MNNSRSLSIGDKDHQIYDYFCLVDYQVVRCDVHPQIDKDNAALSFDCRYRLIRRNLNLEPIISDDSSEYIKSLHFRLLPLVYFMQVFNIGCLIECSTKISYV